MSYASTGYAKKEIASFLTSVQANYRDESR